MIKEPINNTWTKKTIDPSTHSTESLKYEAVRKQTQFITQAKIKLTRMTNLKTGESHNLQITHEL